VIAAAAVVALTATGIGLLATPAGATSGTTPPGTGRAPRPGPCENLPPAKPGLAEGGWTFDLDLDGTDDPIAVTPVPGRPGHATLETNLHGRLVAVEVSGPGSPRLDGITGLMYTRVPEIIIGFADAKGETRATQHWMIDGCRWVRATDANLLDPPGSAPHHPVPVTVQPKYTG
jgi:hypothetical protein